MCARKDGNIVAVLFYLSPYRGRRDAEEIYSYNKEKPAIYFK
jgi:hypothetical protein